MITLLKIITGSAKGRRLQTLPTEATRPTSERIKEAVFSSLQFDIEGRHVLDLFAGCGQLGLEALSRGAENVMFIDSAQDAMNVVKANARSTGFFDRCRYLVSDYRNYIRKAAGRDVYDLVFIDPPYDMECCVDALFRLADAGLLAAGALIVLESGTEAIDDEQLAPFEILKSTRYGKKTAIRILFYRGKEAE